MAKSKVTIKGKLVLQKVTKERVTFELAGAGEVIDLRKVIIDPAALPEGYDFALHDLSGKLSIEIEAKER